MLSFVIMSENFDAQTPKDRGSGNFIRIIATGGHRHSNSDRYHYRGPRVAINADNEI